ncbi:hypothetical protein NPIL_144811 [Nephila pilipes]|uniref:C2H2-type domain-containing protein n=1 Tax=Nephila pilipes TaxID=299642 RepID=A0A8X6TW42_NEPPI|nr:hypothetical protein NPIL_660011 [Nephila pilipes]GFT77923.1 hypothetical protein NPIL_144811 [Nephila pilipes]
MTENRENIAQSVPLIDLVDISNDKDLKDEKPDLDVKPDLDEIKSKQYYMCDKCRKQFSSKSCLNLHYACHLQERPRVCDVCGESFSQAGDFADHYAQHCIEQEFECFTCEEIFFDKAEFDLHQRLHKVAFRLTRHLDKHSFEYMDYEPEVGINEEPFDETTYIEADVSNSATASDVAI